ncbi:MAG: EthD domain-containing protein [Pseudomonas sp.]
MEKIMYSLWKLDPRETGNEFRNRLLQEVAPQLLTAGVHKLRMMVVDDAVAAADGQCMINTKPAMDGMVSLWVDSAMHREPLEAILEQHAGRFHGYLVVESEPYPEERKRRSAPYLVAEGERTPGMNQVVFLRCPPRLSYEQWYELWREEHGPIAYPTQGTFGYRQNTVHRVLTYAAPHFDAIVEENFVPEAIGDADGFYDAKGDPARRARNEQRMMESVNGFIDLDKIDCIQTSEYIVKA